MKVKSFGPEELSDGEIDDLVHSAETHGRKITHFYYWYQIDTYDGDGVAVYKDDKDDWHLDDLGHCSCFGPLEDGFNAITYTEEQIIEMLEKRRGKNYYAPGIMKLELPFIIQEIKNGDAEPLEVHRATVKKKPFYKAIAEAVSETFKKEIGEGVLEEITFEDSGVGFLMHVHTNKRVDFLE